MPNLMAMVMAKASVKTVGTVAAKAVDLGVQIHALRSL
jgi:hypothetical protein